MKKLPSIFALLLLLNTSFSQSIKKYPIGSTGCSAYFFCEPSKRDVNYSEDSSAITTQECLNDGIHYGIICVQLKVAITSLSDAEDMMIAYLDYLKTTFKIRSATGYGKGHRLKGREDTRGIIDYWMDETKDNWKVKSWTDGKFIGVLYAYGTDQKELPETKVNVFLDSFRLPGM
ncbi:MAG: hypothetical protein JNN00_09090 [Chitinophagaceae bacterium]|nr:hypothetical protein [Chitinophagaceae bacterium]